MQWYQCRMVSTAVSLRRKGQRVNPGKQVIEDL